MAHRWAAVAAVAALTAALLLVVAVPASGHAAFVSSEPAPGSDLSAAPAVVTLQFSEPLIDDLSHATVTAPTGEQFTGGPVGDNVIRVELTSTAQGEYTVAWRTVSPLDGHTLRGRFQFGVGTDVGPQADPSGAPAGIDLVIAVGRTVEYVGLLAALGWLSLAALTRSTGSSWVPTGLRRWVLLAAGGGAATVTGELLLASGGALGSAARAFLAAESGPPRVGRLAVELAAVIVVVRAVRRTGDRSVSRRSTRAWTALLMVAALMLLSAAGHAAAGGWPTIVTNAGHLAAAGIWAGTIIAMAVHRPPDGWTGETGRSLLAEFTPIALTGFGATVLLGSLRGVQALTAPHDLWQTSYGLTLTLKVLLVVLMVPMSVRSWRRRAPLPRSEATLAVAVVIAAAVLAAYPVTPDRAAGDPADASDADEVDGLPRPGDLTLASEAGTTVVGLTVRPGAPGLNDLYLFLVPTGGVEEAGDLEAALAVEGLGPVDVRPCGPACRTATVSLTGGEALEVEVVGRGGGEASFELPDLPAPDGTELLTAVDERMAQLDTFAYDETFGPHEPPTLSVWQVVAPDRLHGVIRRGDDYRETIRIADRRWNRDDPGGRWEGGEPGGLTVTANRFIWDQAGRTAVRVVDTDTVDGADTRVVSFFVAVSEHLPVWYRLWVDDDQLVRKAEMRTQGHFMDHRYHSFDTDLGIRPPA